MSSKKKVSFIQEVLNSNKSFSPQRIDRLIRNSDLIETDGHGHDALMTALYCNAYSNLFLSTKQWDYLIQGCDLKKSNSGGLDAMSIYIDCYEEQKVDLTSEQRTYLFNHSNLQQLDGLNYSKVNYLFENKAALTTLFTLEQVDYLVDHVPFNVGFSMKECPKEMLNNYLGYKIEKEKRLLLTQLVRTHSLTASKINKL